MPQIKPLAVFLLLDAWLAIYIAAAAIDIGLRLK